MIDPSVCLCVCLSASMSLEPLDRSSRNFMRRSPVAVAQSSSGGVTLRYVLPVLCMTSRLTVVGRMTVHELSVVEHTAPHGVARQGRSLMSMNALFSLQSIHCITLWCRIRMAVCGQKNYTYLGLLYFAKTHLKTTQNKRKLFCIVSTQFPIEKFSVVLAIYFRLDSCKLETGSRQDKTV